MALAGTQQFKGSVQVAWESKEKEEQQIVTDYILKQLENFNLNISDPFTKKAGSLLHIVLKLQVNYNPMINWNLLSINCIQHLLFVV